MTDKNLKSYNFYVCKIFKGQQLRGDVNAQRQPNVFTIGQMHRNFAEEVQQQAMDYYHQRQLVRPGEMQAETGQHQVHVQRPQSRESRNHPQQQRLPDGQKDEEVEVRGETQVSTDLEMLGLDDDFFSLIADDERCDLSCPSGCTACCKQFKDIGCPKSLFDVIDPLNW